MLEFLENTDSRDLGEALGAWDIRKDQFNDFLDGFSGIGWNTFDYVLRDLHHPGCLFLFKVDSINDALIGKVASSINLDRSKYLSVLSDSGILDRFPIAAVNIAIYAFCSSSCLGFLSRIAVLNGRYHPLARPLSSQLGHLGKLDLADLLVTTPRRSDRRVELQAEVAVQIWTGDRGVAG